MESDLIIRVLDSIIDIGDRLMMKKYLNELESEVTRLRDLNDKFIKVIDTLKNKQQ